MHIVCIMVMVMVQLFSPDSESFSLFTFFPPPELVHDDDLTVGFIRLNNLPAMFAIEVNNGQEYVLCFNGKSKSRTQYITHHIHCITSNMHDGECLWLLEDDVSSVQLLVCTSTIWASVLGSRNWSGTHHHLTLVSGHLVLRCHFLAGVEGLW